MNQLPFSAASVFLGAFLALSPLADAQRGHGLGYPPAVKTCAPVQGTVSLSIGRGTPVSLNVSHTFAPVHREVVHERVWVPGCSRRVWVPPVYETRYDGCGRPYVVEVACGHRETIHEPGYYELRRPHGHGHGHGHGRGHGSWHR